jgi:hypothetical protein
MTPTSLLYLLTSFILGIWFSFLIPFRLPAWSRILFGPAFGMILLGEITFFAALFLPLNPTVIFIPPALLALIILILHRSNLFSRFQQVNLPKFCSEWIRSCWPLGIVIFSFGLIVIYIYATRVLAPDASGVIISRGGLYGDTAFHNAQITSFASQGVPVPNPLYAGVPLRYPFLVNFYAACLMKLGMSLRAASVLPQIFNFLGFITLFHLFAKKITTQTGVFFSFLILLLGWGFGFVDYFKDSIANGSWAITKEYTNDMQLFRMQNIITGLILPQRGLLSGFVIGLLLTVCFLYDEKPLNRKQGIWLGIFLGILPLWHVHSFLFMAFSSLIWCWFRYRKDWKPSLEGILMFGSISLVLAFPFMLWFSEQISSSFRWQWGWTQPDLNPVLFWVANTGLVIPIAALSLQQESIRSRYYIFVPAFIVFMVANLIVFQPWDWDNVKLFVWVFLFASILAGSYLSVIFSRKFAFKALVTIILITLTASGLISIIRLVSPAYVYTIYDQYDLALAEWVKENTSPFSTFLISDVPAHPVTGLTGRSAYLGYPGYVWVHGIPFRKRLAVEKRILNGDLSGLQDLEIPVEYIVAETSLPLSRRGGAGLSVSYKNAKYTVFKISAEQ